MSGFSKRIKKSLDANDQEDCLMEIGDVVNRYISAARFKRNPTSTISWANTPNVSDHFVPMQTDMNTPTRHNESTVYGTNAKSS